MVSHPGGNSQLRSRRIPFRRRVLVAPRRGGERRFEESFDLSLGGMFIVSMLPLNVGEVVDLDIPLDALRFQAAAKVVWIRAADGGDEEPVGMAVEFLGLNPNQKRVILRQITNHTQSGGQLKVGSTQSASSSTARRPISARPSPYRKWADGSPGRLWLVAGAVAIAVAILVLALLL